MEPARRALKASLPLFGLAGLFALVGILSITKPFVHTSPASVNRFGGTSVNSGPPVLSDSVAYGVAFLLVAAFLLWIAVRVANNDHDRRTPP